MSTIQGFGRCNNSTALVRYVPCCAVTDIKISCPVPDQLADQTATGGKRKRRNRIIKYRCQLFRPHLLQERLKNCSMCVCVRAWYFFQLWWIKHHVKSVSTIIPPPPKKKIRLGETKCWTTIWEIFFFYWNAYHWFRFLWPCIMSKVWREKPNKMQQLDVYY